MPGGRLSVNFDQLVCTILEGKKDEWVLFLKVGFEQDYKSILDAAYQLKPLSWLTDEEKEAIKNEMKPSHAYMNAKEGMDVLDWPEVTAIFGSKRALEDEIEEFKSIYRFAKKEYPLEPELKPHWGGIIDEL